MALSIPLTILYRVHWKITTGQQSNTCYTGILAEHQGAGFIQMLGLAEAPSAPKPQDGQVLDE